MGTDAEALFLTLRRLKGRSLLTLSAEKDPRARVYGAPASQILNPAEHDTREGGVRSLKTGISHQIMPRQRGLVCTLSHMPSWPSGRPPAANVAGLTITWLSPPAARL